MLQSGVLQAKISSTFSTTVYEYCKSLFFYKTNFKHIFIFIFRSEGEIHKITANEKYDLLTTVNVLWCTYSTKLQNAKCWKIHLFISIWGKVRHDSPQQR
jgi:hypothetical protein